MWTEEPISNISEARQGRVRKELVLQSWKFTHSEFFYIILYSFICNITKTSITKKFSEYLTIFISPACFTIDIVDTSFKRPFLEKIKIYSFDLT